jgi:pyridoxal phosphate enzyme (YggS family)
MIAENIEQVRQTIRETCFRCGRKPEDVLVLAVTKTFPGAMIQEAVAAGILDFGENYVQELKKKRQELQDSNIRWHFIGHLQSNKVRHIAEYVHLVHSVDNLGVAEEINKRAEQAHRIVDVLLEVHTTDEATKFGVLAGETLDLVKHVSNYKNVRVVGLMTMGPFSDNPNDSRPSFRQVADLKKRIEQEGISNVSMKHLSMGMTHDFEVAVEEGATIVRIGTAIFGPRAAAG